MMMMMWECKKSEGEKTREDKSILKKKKRTREKERIIIFHFPCRSVNIEETSRASRK